MINYINTTSLNANDPCVGKVILFCHGNETKDSAKNIHPYHWSCCSHSLHGDGIADSYLTDIKLKYEIETRDQKD